MAVVRLTCVCSGTEFDTVGGFVDGDDLRLVRRWTQILELHAGEISTRWLQNGRWAAPGPPGC